MKSIRIPRIPAPPAFLKTGLIVLLSLALYYCHYRQGDRDDNPIQPVVVTEAVKYDTDDPAIWIHPQDPAQSLVLGTDKHRDGALYVFDLSGKIIPGKTVRGLKRPNNVDIEYGFSPGGKAVDIAVVTERDAREIRIFRLPDLAPLDNGGIKMFAGEASRAVMGVALFKRPADHTVFVIVSRKSGVSGKYLWQYRLEDGGDGTIEAVKVREFGNWSGGDSEIEAVAVDDELGYIYYSDELAGVRKYHADPDHPLAHQELALFATENFAKDREGISIYRKDAYTGYILVSDQQANRFHVFKREGEPGNPHLHKTLSIVTLSARASDGSEVTEVPLDPRFPRGFFMAMSEDRTFHFYSWADIFNEAGLSAAPAEEFR